MTVAAAASVGVMVGIILAVVVCTPEFGASETRAGGSRDPPSNRGTHGARAQERGCQAEVRGVQGKDVGRLQCCGRLLLTVAAVLGSWVAAKRGAGEAGSGPGNAVHANHSVRTPKVETCGCSCRLSLSLSAAVFFLGFDFSGARWWCFVDAVAVTAVSETPLDQTATAMAST